MIKALTFWAAVLLLLAQTHAHAYAVVFDEGRGYFNDYLKGDCAYTQIIEEQKYFFKEMTSKDRIITFDNPRCFRAIESNFKSVEVLMSRLHAQSWVEFDYEDSARMRGTKWGLVRGYCVPAKNATVALLIDFIVKDGFVTQIVHKGTIKQMCE